MATFEYAQQGLRSLTPEDIYKLFNNYRIWKYIIAILLKLNKTQIPDYKILEAGCGGGDKLRFFTELRARPENCYGLDISENAINLCNTLSPDTMNFQVGSVFDLPFENNTFDIIFCSGLFDCFQDDNDILRISREFNRVITADGVLIAIDINENFQAMYRNSETVMEKKLRSFDFKKGELEHLLSGEFNLFLKMYILGAEIYRNYDGTLAQITDLHRIDGLIDCQEFPCAYSLWTFLKNK